MSQELNAHVSGDTAPGTEVKLTRQNRMRWMLLEAREELVMQKPDGETQRYPNDPSGLVTWPCAEGVLIGAA